MPACFELISKNTNVAVRLATIDNEMCEFFGSVPDTQWYFRNWYDRIGFLLAMGKSFSQVREFILPDLIPVVDYLDARYTVHAWHEW